MKLLNLPSNSVNCLIKFETVVWYFHESSFYGHILLFGWKGDSSVRKLALRSKQSKENLAITITICVATYLPTYIQFIYNWSSSFSSCYKYYHFLCTFGGEPLRLISSALWDIKPFSLYTFNCRFGVTCRHSLQWRRISHATNEHEAGSRCHRGVSEGLINEPFLLPASCLCLAWLILRPWRKRWHFSSKFPLTLNGVYGVMSQKIELFVTIGVITWTPTFYSRIPAISLYFLCNGLASLFS
jgi:hypothetical protein